MDSSFQISRLEMSDDSVEQMLALAERLRLANGGELDESAVQAVAEATGAPLEYVRVLVKVRAEKEKPGTVASLRAQFLTLGPETRRYVISGVAASLCALLQVVGGRVDAWANATRSSNYAIFGMFALIATVGAAYNVSLSRDAKTAAVAGGLFAGGYYMMVALFSLLFGAQAVMSEFRLIPFTLLGALAGYAIFKVVEQNRTKLGLKDPTQERQELLRQLHDLQDRLYSGRQSMTFLSVDIVGSTKMKEQSDPLSVEFTFNEYHQFVERIARKYGGRVHSTAGDGVICAFDQPAAAFGAARNMQAEMLEFNTFRNKLATPVVVRAGIHAGSVVAPDAGDPSSVNFAHVIDIAAHLQKLAPPGGIAVSDASAAGLVGGATGVGSRRVEAMNVGASVWEPRSPAPASA